MAVILEEYTARYKYKMHLHPLCVEVVWWKSAVMHDIIIVCILAYVNSRRFQSGFVRVVMVHAMIPVERRTQGIYSYMM